MKLDTCIRKKAHLSAPLPVAIAILLILIISPPLRSGELEDTESSIYMGPIERLAKKVIASLPREEGLVVDVLDDRLVLNFGNQPSPLSGTILRVFRKGKEITHPETGELLGYIETDIGLIEIVEVRENYSLARPVQLFSSLRPERGDVVGSASAKTDIVILPILNRTGERINTEALYYDLTRLLERSGRFRVEDADQVLVWMLESGLDAEALQGREGFEILKKDLPADFYLISQIKSFKERYVLDAVLKSFKGGKTIQSVSVLIQEPPVYAAEPPPGPKRRPPPAAASQERRKEEIPAERTPEPKPPRAVSAPEESTRQRIVRREKESRSRYAQERPSRSTANGTRKSGEFEFRINALDVGDIDGDGVNEIVAALQNKVYAFKYDRGEFIQFLKYDGTNRDNYLSMDVADINGNGLAEIYVTNLQENTLNSFVLEMGGGRLRTIKKGMKLYFRVLHYPGMAEILLGQEYGLRRPFFGGVSTYDWREDSLVKKAALKLPEGVRLYDFTMGDLNGDGEGDILYFNKEERLELIDNSGNLLWRSRDFYGGSEINFKFETREEREAHPVARELTTINRTHLQGRIVLWNPDGETLPDLLVAQNTPPRASRTVKGITEVGGLGGYEASSVVDLYWSGSGLEEAWRTKENAGYTSDFALGDVDGDGEYELVVAVVYGTGLFEAGKSQIIMHELR